MSAPVCVLPATVKIGSLCSGYGGLDTAVAAGLAGRNIDASPGWHAEIDPGACAVLAYRHSDVPNYGNLVALADQLDADPTSVPPVHVLAMGVPGQPVSSAGRQQ